jgi:hypothetical protein
VKKLSLLLLVVLAAGCKSAGKPHAFRIVTRPDPEVESIYKLVWPGSSAKPITIGYYPADRLLSPDGRLLAIGGEADLKIVDLVHRTAYAPHLGEGCYAWPTLWRLQRRLILTLWCGSAHVSTRSELLVLDPEARRFIGRGQIGLSYVREARAAAVLVTTPPLGRRDVPGSAIREELEGPARLLRVRASGETDEILLPIRAGSRNSRTFNRSPAVVLDAKARHAYVIGEGEGCARVDLRTLRVEWHRLPHAFDAQAGLASKPQEHLGTTNPSRDLDRRALWLGDGKIAITGEDVWTSDGFDRTAPAGLKILDTRTWKVRLLDPRVSLVRIVRNRLVATGPNAGLIIYSFSGDRLLRRFVGKNVSVSETRGRRIKISVQTLHIESNPKLDHWRKASIDLP